MCLLYFNQMHLLLLKQVSALTGVCLAYYTIQTAVPLFTRLAWSIPQSKQKFQSYWNVVRELRSTNGISDAYCIMFGALHSARSGYKLLGSCLEHYTAQWAVVFLLYWNVLGAFSNPHGICNPPWDVHGVLHNPRRNSNPEIPRCAYYVVQSKWQFLSLRHCAWSIARSKRDFQSLLKNVLGPVSNPNNSSNPYCNLVGALSNPNGNQILTRICLKNCAIQRQF